MALVFKELLYFYIVLSVANVIFAPPIFKLMTTIGTNINMFIAAVVQALVNVLLSLYAGPGPLLWTIAILSAVAHELYWSAFHANFSLSKDKKDSGKQVSFFAIVIGLAQAIIPLVGGVVGYFFGINVLYIPAAILLVGGLLPLLTH